MALSNPFSYSGPIIDSTMFVGRRKALAQLWHWATRPTDGLQLFLEGVPGIGKTSLLIRMREGAQGTYLVPVIVDAAKLPLESPVEFLWRLSQQLSEGIRGHNLEVPNLEKSALVLRSWANFRDFYWKQLPHFLGDKILILAVDNFDSLFLSSSESNGAINLRNYVLNLLNEYSQTRAIFVLRGRAQAYASRLLFPFNQIPIYRLRSLSLADTVELMNKSDQFRVFEDISNLVYNLTMGHPADVQRICHALFQRVQAGSIRQPAMSDIISILDVELAPKDFYTNLYGRYARFFLQFA